MACYHPSDSLLPAGIKNILMNEQQPRGTSIHARQAFSFFRS